MRITKLMPVIVVAAALLLAGCGRSPEDARKDLGKMNIPYTEQAFAEAAGNKDMTAVKLFLEAGMSPNLPAGESTPLIEAANKSNLEMIKLLVEKGADVNGKSKDGLTPVMVAVTAEGAAAERQEAVKFLLEKGADLNVRYLLNGFGVTPLMLAVQQKDLEVVKLILAHKVDVNSYDNNTRWTALMAAVNDNSLEIVKELLAKGANVNFKAKNNVTALDLARGNNNAEMVKLLTNAGAK